MEEISAIKYEEKKSRFYAHLYRIIDERDLEAIITVHRKKYKKAAHRCVAAGLPTAWAIYARNLKMTAR